MRVPTIEDDVLLLIGMSAWIKLIEKESESLSIDARTGLKLLREDFNKLWATVSKEDE